MIFKQCSKCNKDLGPHNCERIQLNEIGLWMHHTECKGTSVLPLAEVQRRSEEKANGNPFKQIEIDYYKQRLESLKHG